MSKSRELAEAAGATFGVTNPDGDMRMEGTVEFTVTQFDEFCALLVSALSIQQEADAKDAERFRWLLSRWFGEHGGWDFKNALTPEEVIAELDTAMATPTDSEDK